MTDAPTTYPLAHGIETTTYTYPTKRLPSRADPNTTVEVPDTSQPAKASTTRFYHDGCGGEWTSSGEVEYVTGIAEMRYRCSACRAFGRHRERFPVEKTLS